MRNVKLHNNGREKSRNVKLHSNGRKKSRKYKKSRSTSWLIILIFIFVLLILLIGLLKYFLVKEEKELVEKISSHYNEFVHTKEEVNIYNKDEQIIGKLYNSSISLEDISIDKNTKYFKIKDFEDTYIKYDDVEVIDSLPIIDTRYKKYIVFNQNVVTNDKTTFYDNADNKVYEFYKSFDLPIIIKENDKYGVEFNNRLLYIKKYDVNEIKDNYNTDLNNSSGVGVLNYHAFYDETNPDEVAKCTTVICHSKAQFKTHLDYFKNNNILTLTMKEMEMYIDGKLQLPKSVLITIDDGPKTEHAVDMLTEYKMNATIFLVTSWVDESIYYKTDYIEFHSHSHDLHDVGVCPGGQGGAIKCLDRNTLLEDLRQSREDLNGSAVFCYPFYEFNNYSISVLKEAGFTMAFMGQVPTYYGYKLAEVGCDKFRIPRFVIVNYTTIEDIDNYFNEIKN